ncbi:MAG: Ig-like domain-containing protein [bacterium]|nr:MAG: Ig-like domain-containing protein [bacterium]
MGRMRSNLIVNRKRGGFALSLVLGALLISSLLVALTGCTTELIDTINKMVDFYNRTDKVASGVLATNPKHGETNVYRNRKITVTFDETMDTETINNSSFTLSDGLQNVKGTVTYVKAFNMAVFAPASTLFESNKYTATLTRDVRDLIGNRLEDGYAWFFTTGTDLDTVNPFVIPGSEIPLAGSIDVVLNTKIAMEFSEPLDPTTINASTIQISPSPDAASLSESSGGFSYNDANKTVVYTPGSNLQLGTEYTVTVTTGVKDLAGNPLASEYSWVFTAGAEPDFDPPILVDWGPPNFDITVGIDSNADQSIFVQFNEPINATTLNTQTFSLRKNGKLVTGEVQYDADIFMGVYVLLPEADAKLSYITQYTISVSGAIEDMAGNPLGTGKSLTFVTVASDASADGVIVDLMKIGAGPKAEQFSGLVNFTNLVNNFLPGLTKYHFEVQVRINSDSSFDWKMLSSKDLYVSTIPQPKVIALLVDTSAYMGEFWDMYLEMMNDFVKTLGPYDQLVLITYAAEDPRLDPSKVLKIYPETGFTTDKELILKHLEGDIVPKDPPWLMGWEAIGKGLELIEDFRKNSPDDAAMGHRAVVAFTTADNEHFNPYIHTYDPDILLGYAEKIEAYIYSLMMYPATKLDDLAALGDKSSRFVYLFEDPRELWDSHLGALEFMGKYLKNVYMVSWDMTFKPTTEVDVGVGVFYPTETEGTYKDYDEIINYVVP